MRIRLSKPVPAVCWTVALTCIAAQPSAADSPPSGAAATQPASRSAVPALDDYVDAMLAAVERAREQLPATTAAAEIVAQRWIAGAELCVGGDPSFSDEAFYRAGGLIGLRRIAGERMSFNGRTITWRDVPKGAIILWGLHRNVDPGILLFDEINQLAHDDHTVVLFGSSRWPAVRKVLEICRRRLPADHVLFVDTGLPVDTRLWVAGTPVSDYSPTAQAAWLWAFTAELVAACTRQGSTPAIWPSGAIPDYEPWEARYKDICFHDDLHVEPIAAGTLGREYLDIVQKQLEACRDVAPQIATGARLISKTPAANTVYVVVEAHLLAEETWLPVELANWLPVQRSWRWQRASGSRDPGDGLLWVGYIDWPNGLARTAAQRGTPLVAVSVRGPGENVRDEPLRVPTTAPADVGSAMRAMARGLVNGLRVRQAAPQDLPANVLWIPAPWQYPDAVVEIPGYPLPACPTSGIIQGTLMWSIVGEAVRLQTQTREELSAGR